MTAGAPGNGFALLAVGGWNASEILWHDLLEQLRHRGFEICLVVPAYSSEPAGRRDAIEMVVETLRGTGADRTILVAHSAGAPLAFGALRASHILPRGIVQISPTGHRPVAASFPSRQWLNIALRAGVRSRIARLTAISLYRMVARRPSWALRIGDYLHLTSGVAHDETLLPEYLQEVAERSTRSMEASLLGIEQFPDEPAPADIPTLIVHGELDPISHPSALADTTAPTVRVITVPAGAHSLIVDEPDLIAGAIESFFRSLTTPTDEPG